MDWPTSKPDLLNLSIARINEFCTANQIEVPSLKIWTKEEWSFGVCAYYRPQCINICLEKCQTPCTDSVTRNWTWPASTTDREPYGVVAHELGHHMDWLASDVKGPYYGNHSIRMRIQSNEKPITSYCPNDAEWFAEIARLFITNPDLLRLIRPKTYELLIEKWIPPQSDDWLTTLGTNVPARVVKALRNKISGQK